MCPLIPKMWIKISKTIYSRIGVHSWTSVKRTTISLTHLEGPSILRPWSFIISESCVCQLWRSSAASAIRMLLLAKAGYVRYAQSLMLVPHVIKRKVILAIVISWYRILQLSVVMKVNSHSKKNCCRYNIFPVIPTSLNLFHLKITHTKICAWSFLEVKFATHDEVYYYKWWIYIIIWILD